MKKKRVAILISGRGSNMAALIDAAASPDFPGEIVGVISNRPDAKGLAIAAAKGVSTSVIPSKGVSREDHDAALDKALAGMKAEIVCLAGYLRLLTDGFVARWSGRLINIHPALLPLFKGLNTHEQALAAGMRIHGCTVHFVTPEMDDGPIIAQAAVPVLASDDAEMLGARVLAAEHHIYPLGLALVAEGKARMEGGRTVFADFSEETGAGRLVSAPAPRPKTADIESLARFTP
ncbi:phosphoribosylglycinamide formyltransferase [Mesorhizobium australicum]|uniref:Phosphoribosylglycinamide formyltransferase n=1 Tax=Mesorhizobium australicum TaxID=536018 RepID=A0A1X7P0N2_9HYPH|nr:phosphoribosylglycinamide formyltransferase [Mesorhizobium australicum]SMH44284.1 formyltetrahydrofolate-dependent phosphoribosylglycinamide formyltransferase [Mesorhizobium australicum]